MSNLEFNTELPDYDFDRKLVSKKLDGLKDLQYITNAEIANKILLDYQKKSPNNNDLETLINAVMQIQFYVHELQNDKHLLQLAMSEYRNDKIRAIERARRAESKQSKEN